MTQSLTNYQKVREFNTVFGHPVADLPVTNIFEKSPNIVKLRNNLIREEYGELIEAFQALDVVEMIDALSDIQYVAYGLQVVYGIDGDKLFREYMSNKFSLEEQSGNYGKRLSDKADTNFKMTSEFVNDFFSGIISTPKQFKCNLDSYGVEPNINTQFYRQLNVVKTYIADIESRLIKLDSATENQNFDEVSKSVLDIIYFTYVIGYLIGVDMDESVRLVHESNMSKICSTREEAIETVAWYKANESRYDTPMFRESETGFTVFNESTGKILKNINYKAVDLTVFL